MLFSLSTLLQVAVVTQHLTIVEHGLTGHSLESPLHEL